MIYYRVYQLALNRSYEVDDFSREKEARARIKSLQKKVSCPVVQAM